MFSTDKFSIFFFSIAQLILVINTDIRILNNGIIPPQEDEIALIFFITIKNTCDKDLLIETHMIQCCETIDLGDEECNSITLIGKDFGVLYPNETTNLTLIFPNIYTRNREGVCSISITYHNHLAKKDIDTEIHFDTTKLPLTLNDNRKISDLNLQQCQTFDLDLKCNCNPVDCLIKYSGMISSFNLESNRCQRVPVCYSSNGCRAGSSGSGNEMADIAYSPYINECVDVNFPITKVDLDDIENIIIQASNDANHLANLNTICHYGMITDSGECLCYHNWETSLSSEGPYEPTVAQRHLCNINLNKWTNTNQKHIRLSTILMTLLVLTIISKLLICMCLMTWCYNRFNSRNDNNKSDQDQNDDKSSSVILYDEHSVTLSHGRCYCPSSDIHVNYIKTKQPLNKKKIVFAKTTISNSKFSDVNSSLTSIITTHGFLKYTGMVQQEQQEPCLNVTCGLNRESHNEIMSVEFDGSEEQNESYEGDYEEEGEEEEVEEEAVEEEEVEEEEEEEEDDEETDISGNSRQEAGNSEFSQF